MKRSETCDVRSAANSVQENNGRRLAGEQKCIAEDWPESKRFQKSIAEYYPEKVTQNRRAFQSLYNFVRYATKRQNAFL
jgi:hypothetical protein